MLDLSNLFYRNKDQPDYVMIAIVFIIVLLIVTIVISSLNKGSNEPFLYGGWKEQAEQAEQAKQRTELIELDSIENTLRILRQQKDGSEFQTKWFKASFNRMGDYLEKYPDNEQKLKDLVDRLLTDEQKQKLLLEDDDE